MISFVSLFFFYQQPRKIHLRGALLPSLTPKTLHINKTRADLLPDSVPHDSHKATLLWKCSNMGLQCTHCLYQNHFYGKLSDSRPLYTHFVNCHYSNISILHEGLKGHGEWAPSLGESQLPSMKACVNSRRDSFLYADESNCIALGLQQHYLCSGRQDTYCMEKKTSMALQHVFFCMENVENPGQQPGSNLSALTVHTQEK